MRKTMTTLMVLAVICVTTLSANARSGWGTRVRSDGRVSGRPGRNQLNPSSSQKQHYCTLKVSNNTDTKLRVWYSVEGGEWGFFSVRPGRMYILPIEKGGSGNRATFSLKAEKANGSTYATSSVVAVRNGTAVWHIR